MSSLPLRGCFLDFQRIILHFPLPWSPWGHLPLQMPVFCTPLLVQSVISGYRFSSTPTTPYRMLSHAYLQVGFHSESSLPYPPCQSTLLPPLCYHIWTTEAPPSIWATWWMFSLDRTPVVSSRMAGSCGTSIFITQRSWSLKISSSLFWMDLLALPRLSNLIFTTMRFLREKSKYLSELPQMAQHSGLRSWYSVAVIDGLGTGPLTTSLGSRTISSRYLTTLLLALELVTSGYDPVFRFSAKLCRMLSGPSSMPSLYVSSIIPSFLWFPLADWLACNILLLISYAYIYKIPFFVIWWHYSQLSGLDLATTISLPSSAPTWELACLMSCVALELHEVEPNNESEPHSPSPS